MTDDETEIAALIERYAAPVPRYTSYPTAPHFHPGIDAATYRDWLAHLPEQAKLSLYMHVPFCDTLCWFCGCHTKITRQYAPVEAYLHALTHEIDTIARLVPGQARVSHIHWGGGSPTMLHGDDILRLADATREAFQLTDDCEFAVEIDPRGMDKARVDALAQAGLTRVSLGVQDFDPGVQQAINRIQTFDETRQVLESFREKGVRSLNIDAIYGLPGQTDAKLLATLEAVVSLRPDRLAVFGYAHVPWMKKHQTMIREGELPGPVARFHQARLAADFLVDAGYHRIGLDHFALPHDAMAEAAAAGVLQRNFQGYTVDPADALLGLGASSIGKLPNGYVQNEGAIAQYQRRVAAGGLATTKGVTLSRDDEVRNFVIERLMCDLALDRRVITDLYGTDAIGVIATIDDVIRDDRDAFVAETPHGFSVTERGRPFLRTIAARFDAYLVRQRARHSLAV
jgi:oxygen-independent coproporphyrinogen-3 oxidase